MASAAPPGQLGFTQAQLDAKAQLAHLPQEGGPHLHPADPHSLTLVPPSVQPLITRISETYWNRISIGSRMGIPVGALPYALGYLKQKRLAASGLPVKAQGGRYQATLFASGLAATALGSIVGSYVGGLTGEWSVNKILKQERSDTVAMLGGLDVVRVLQLAGPSRPVEQRGLPSNTDSPAWDALRSGKSAPTTSLLPPPPIAEPEAPTLRIRIAREDDERRRDFEALLERERNGGADEGRKWK
ncbi:hypothetical protein P7C70_g8151, partial [Phenoliferia sp. Uapishka_3]